MAIDFTAYAVIPAAGESRRMGQTKLLLPWREKPLLAHVISAFQAAGVANIFVVTRADQHDVAACAQQYDARVVQPDSPPVDMKASLRAGLETIEATFHLAANDCWLVSPGDVPQLSPEVIRRLLVQHVQSPSMALVPSCGERRAHPALLPWSWRARLASLPADAGLNRLLQGGETRVIPCEDILNSAVLGGIDTPGDYQSLLSPPAE